MSQMRCAPKSCSTTSYEPTASEGPSLNLIAILHNNPPLNRYALACGQHRMPDTLAIQRW